MKDEKLRMKIKNEFIIQPLHSTWGIKIGVRVSWSVKVGWSVSVSVSVEGNCFEQEFFGQKKRGKLLVSHRYNLLPLLRSRPGGFRGSWSYKTYPTTKLNRFFGFWVCP